MSVVLHLSDPHFGTEQSTVCEALVALTEREQPELMVLSGDITQRARRAQFRAAQRYVERLGIDARIVIPGNHDIALFNLLARLFAPWSTQQAYFGSELEPEFQDEDLLLIGVNTTRRYRHKDGEVSRDQIERVAHRLQGASPHQLRVVVTHQPIAVTLPKDEKNLLRGHRTAMNAWAAAGADLVLGGHIHLPFVLGLHERHSSLARPLWAVQAGTAVSTRTRANVPNSINLIRWPAATRPPAERPAAFCATHEIVGSPLPCPTAPAERACAVEQWDFDETTGSFRLAAEHRLALSRD